MNGWFLSSHGQHDWFRVCARHPTPTSQDIQKWRGPLDLLSQFCSWIPGLYPILTFLRSSSLKTWGPSLRIWVVCIFFKIFQWHLVGFMRGSVVFLWHWVDCKRYVFVQICPVLLRFELIRNVIGSLRLMRCIVDVGLCCEWSLFVNFFWVKYRKR